MRKLDKLKSQARAALGIKNIRSWMGYDDTVDLETNWKNAIAEYRTPVARRATFALASSESMWRWTSDEFNSRDPLSTTAAFGACEQYPRQPDSRTRTASSESPRWHALTSSSISVRTPSAPRARHEPA